MSELQLRLDCPGQGGFRLQVDCALPARGITALCGPSGSGKTTLLDCIAGLRAGGEHALVRFAGDTWQDGARALPAWRRAVGYVFSDARLFPHLDVAGNLQFAAQRRRGRGGPGRDEVIEWLDLSALLAHRPAQLSAGQRQRVAIGRALLNAPRLLLLDEPLANLDSRASEECLRYLQRLARELDLPMLYVSHAVDEVTRLADHLVLLDAGRVEDQGPLIELCSRIDTRLSREEGAAAILRASVQAHDEAFGLTELAVGGHPLFVNLLPHAAGSALRVRIPARDVSLCRERPQATSILNILPVTIAEIGVDAGARVMLRLALGEQFLLARITRKSAQLLQLATGDQLYAQVKSAALLMDTEDG
ncbi:MAG: molybdenum ABC transporter ATP-binding protein [Halioglobus sp.]|nr:molybdenum ABC transporter ATP-binding protein [Halioglobus sp.]